MLRQRRLLFGVTSAISVAGCTLLLGSDLESGARGTPTQGDATDGNNNINVDGATDGSLGATDGSTNDADAGSNPPCPSYAYFCDGFESGDFAKWTAVVERNGGLMKSATTFAHTGTRAAHSASDINAAVDGSVPSDQAEARVNLNVAKKSGLMAARVYVYMTKTLTTDTTILKFAAPGSDDMNVKIHSTGAFLVDTDTPGSGPQILGNASAPLNKWFCLEWRVTVGTQGHQTLLLDGQPVVDGNEDTATASGYTTFSIGFTAADGDFAQEVYFDDVAVADQPIGCF